MDTDEKKKIIDEIQETFQPDKAKGIAAVIQFNLTDAGSYTLTIRDQRLTIEEGKSAGARLILQASPADFAAIFRRQLEPASAFFQGRLEVQGDVSLAMQLPGLFKRA